jgi:hypothetical protein
MAVESRGPPVTAADHCSEDQSFVRIVEDLERFDDHRGTHAIVGPWPDRGFNDRSANADPIVRDGVFANRFVSMPTLLTVPLATEALDAKGRAKARAGSLTGIGVAAASSMRGLAAPGSARATCLVPSEADHGPQGGVSAPPVDRIHPLETIGRGAGLRVGGARCARSARARPSKAARRALRRELRRRSRIGAHRPVGMGSKSPRQRRGLTIRIGDRRSRRCRRHG